MNLISATALENLAHRYGKNCQINAPLAAHTSARVGGAAKALVTVMERTELLDIVQYCWENDLPFRILGSGSNVLISENGINGVVILNRAKQIEMRSGLTPPQVYAESGANLGTLSRKAALEGISGFEWAVTIPGTVGGAVYGNAGAHHGEISKNLLLAEILQPDSAPVFWNAEQMEYSYRSSVLKQMQKKAVILSATFQGSPDKPTAIKERMQAFVDYRKRTQPPGASMGSMFKNPPGDFAGRIIEAAGLKGAGIGGVTVSPIHANFFVNTEQATASDFWELIQLVKRTVYEESGIELELEVETLGFPSQTTQSTSIMGR